MATYTVPQQDTAHPHYRYPNIVREWLDPKFTGEGFVRWGEDPATPSDIFRSVAQSCRSGGIPQGDATVLLPQSPMFVGVPDEEVFPILVEAYKKPEIVAGELISLTGLSDGGGVPELEGRPFPTEALPPVLREIVEGSREIADVEVPDSMAATAALGITSACIGKGLETEIWGGLRAHANLYVVVAAKTSHGKSLYTDKLVKPLIEDDIRIRKDFKAREAPKIGTRIKILEAEEKKLLSPSELKKGGGASRLELIGEELAELKSRGPNRSFCENATMPGMVKAMARISNESISSYSPDAREAFNILLGAHTNGTADDSFLVKGWSLEPHLKDLSTDDFSVAFEKPWISLLWYVQPDKMHEVLARREFLESGFFPRLLATKIDSSVALPGEGICPALQAGWLDRLRGIRDRFRFADQTTIVKSSQGAKDCLKAYSTEVQGKMNEDWKRFGEIPGKHGENAGRLATNFHAITHAATAGSETLSQEHAESAVEVARWFGDESLSFASFGVATRERGRLTQLLGILKGYGGSQLRGRLKNNHNFEASELISLSELHPDKISVTKHKTTGKGGAPSFRVTAL